MLAKLQRYFVHRPCEESSYFKLFGPVYTQSYHGSPQAPQLCTLNISRVYFFRDLICLPSHLLVGSSGMRFLGRCWVQIHLCLWRRVAWVLSGSSLDANKSRWSNGIPYTSARIFFQDESGEKNLITDKLLQLYGKNNL